MTRPLQTLAYAAALAILCALGINCAAPSIQSRLDALVRPAAYPAVVGQTYPAKAVRVIDGDTLILDIAVGLDTQRTAHVRLAGIDTPERGEAGYKEATAELAALTSGAQLRVTIGAGADGVETKSGDRYIGNVEALRGGKWESVNGAMAGSKWNKLRAAMARTVRAGATQPATRPVEFRIGAWQVPVEDVGKWQARGVGTFFGHVDYGGRMTKAEWERQVGAAGGKFATYAGNDVAAEAQQPGRAGFVQLDEPDLSSHVDKPGNTPAEFAAQYARVIPTGLPMYATFAAFDNFWYDGKPKPTKTDGSKYGHRADTGGWFAPEDRIGFDFYLYTHGRGGAAGLAVWDRMLDRANDWSGGKPIYLFVETCTQGKGTPMTADQWEEMVWHAVDYCQAKGYRLCAVIYFSHVVYPNWKAFDGTPPEIAARMPAVNARLAERMGVQPTTQPTTYPTDPAVLARIGAVEKQQAETAAVIDAIRKAVGATQPSN